MSFHPLAAELVRHVDLLTGGLRSLLDGPTRRTVAVTLFIEPGLVPGDGRPVVFTNLSWDWFVNVRATGLPAVIRANDELRRVVDAARAIQRLVHTSADDALPADQWQVQVFRTHFQDFLAHAWLRSAAADLLPADAEDARRGTRRLRLDCHPYPAGLVAALDSAAQRAARDLVSHRITLADLDEAFEKAGQVRAVLVPRTEPACGRLEVRVCSGSDEVVREVTRGQYRAIRRIVEASGKLLNKDQIGGSNRKVVSEMRRDDFWRPILRGGSGRKKGAGYGFEDGYVGGFLDEW